MGSEKQVDNERKGSKAEVISLSIATFAALVLLISIITWK